MKKSRSRASSALRALERASNKREKEAYVLKLFVTGSTRRSVDAITQIKAVCEEKLKGRYSLQVVDVYQEPSQAEADQVIALPTLIKKLPLPLRKILGDFSEKERILKLLGVTPKTEP